MKVILGILVLGLLFCVVMAFKNENTYRQHIKINEAIYLYVIECIDNGDFNYKVWFGDEEDYDKTLWRLWDWGCTRILPKDKFEIIKPFIK